VLLLHHCWIRRARNFGGLIQEPKIRKRFLLYGRGAAIAPPPNLLEQWQRKNWRGSFAGLSL